MKLNFVVAGANGYVGSNLISLATKLDHSILGISHNKEGYIATHHLKSIAPRSESFSSLNEIRQLIEPNSIFVNCAASVNKKDSSDAIDELIEANIHFSSQLAKLSIDVSSAKFFQISTYSDSIDGSTYSPQTFYAATKRASEDLLTFFHQNWLTDFTFLHLYDVYGPRQPHRRFLPSLIESILKNELFQMSAGEQEVNFVHVDDVCSAIIECAQLNVDKDYQPHHYCIYGPETFLLKELPKQVSNYLGKTYSETNTLFDLPYRKNEIMKFRPRYPIVPGWKPAISLSLGVSQIRGED